MTNNRGCALSLLRPVSWDMRSLGPEQPLLDSIANTVAAWATAAPRGYRSEMLGPGQTVELTVRGPYTDVAVSPSGAAFDLSALVYGLQTLSMTFGKVPDGPDVSNGKLVELARAVLDDADCVSNFQKLAAADGSTAGGLVDGFKSAVTLTFTCLEKVEKIQFSANELLAGFWLGALVWLADGVKQIFQGFVALVDTVQNIGGYIIRVTLPAATPTPTQPPDPGAQPTPQGPAPGGLTARRRDESGSLMVEVDWTAVPGATAYDVVGSAAGTRRHAARHRHHRLDQQHYCSPTAPPSRVRRYELQAAPCDSPLDPRSVGHVVWSED